MDLQEFNKRLNIVLREKLLTGFLKEEYFITWDYNYQSEVHSRMQGIIAKVCFEMGFDVEIERGFNYRTDEDKSRRFVPDISVYKDNKLIAFIEYESTNSSDARFYEIDKPVEWPTSDLRYLRDYMKTESVPQPEYWIIISTLPKDSVDPKKWKSWEIYKKDPDFRKLTDSPFEFYFDKYVKETDSVSKKIKHAVNIALLNLDKNVITIEKSYPKLKI
jgi:hypothetical protein